MSPAPCWRPSRASLLAAWALWCVILAALAGCEAPAPTLIIGDDASREAFGAAFMMRVEGVRAVDGGGFVAVH